MARELSRRCFLRAAATGVSGAMAHAGALGLHGAQRAPRRTPPSDRIVAAVIGCGGQGKADMQAAMAHGVGIAAVCDVDARHMAEAAAIAAKTQGRAPAQVKDYRKLLTRRDIDAVVIATPDHWHALPFVAACQAGWDVYCEKPISHDIREARAMAAAARRSARVVQVGTWQRSAPEFVDAIAYVRRGSLGRVVEVRAWKVDPYRLGRNKPKPPPRQLDYDFWVGPAQMRPYTDKDCHFHWRWYFDYGAGMTGDWGVHMMDIGLLGMSPGTDLVMPSAVSAFGGKLAWPDDDRTTPDSLVATYRFHAPEFVMHWETGRRGLDVGAGQPARARQGTDAGRMVGSQMLDHGTQFIGDTGATLTVWRGGWVVRDPAGAEVPTAPSESHGPADHWQDWIDCIRTRAQPRSSIASMYQTTVVCHLANAAYLCGDTVRWDKARDDIVGAAGRNTIAYHRPYRRHTPSGDWRLPSYAG